MSFFRRNPPSNPPQDNTQQATERRSHVQRLEDNGIYRNPRPYTDDPTQQNMNLFADPENHRTMAYLTRDEALELAIIETIGRHGRNPIHKLLARNWSLYSRSKSGHGAAQMADVLRRTPHPEGGGRRAGRFFGRRTPDE